MRKILTTALGVLAVFTGLMSGTVAPAEARSRGDVFIRHGGGSHGGFGGFHGFRGGGFRGGGFAFRHHGWGNGFAYRPHRYRHYGYGYGYGYGYPDYGDGYYDDSAAAGIVGLAAGALVGSALSHRSYGGGYCASRFRSYDPRSGTYLGYDGRRHPCP